MRLCLFDLKHVEPGFIVSDGYFSGSILVETLIGSANEVAIACGENLCYEVTF